MKTKLALIITVAGLLSTLNSGFSASALGTAFTYQGKLSSGTNAATGNYDLKFSLFNALTSGTQVGSSLTNAATGATNGYFTVTLDFGSVFDGNGRWLEIGVRTNGAANFTTLSPRQPLTPSPYALYAPSAGTASLASTVASGAVGSAGLQTGAVIAGKVAPGAIAASNVDAQTFGIVFWKADGNAGTTPGPNFLGTTDNQPLELRVNGSRALRLEPNASGAPNVIEGSPVNFVLPGVVGATIGGGGATNHLGASYTNSVSGNFGTIGGGYANSVQYGTDRATIGGGNNNTIRTNSWACTIGGGFGNNIEADTGSCTIGGGQQHTVRSATYWSTIGGGMNNTIQGGANSSAISGGSGNSIQTNALDSTIGGGGQNSVGANANYSAIGGGYQNIVQAGALSSAIGGGYQNTIQAGALESTIGGGYSNTVLYSWVPTIGGGQNNIIGYSWGATIPGGGFNFVGGDFSFAAGYRAKANHSGSFVWGDGIEADVASTAPNQFVVRASGGVRFDTFGGGATLDGQPLLNVSSSISGSNVVGGDVQASRLKVGQSHTLSGTLATIAGGLSNSATASYAAVGGGQGNWIEATAPWTTIGGGYGNTIQVHAGYANVGGGAGNTIRNDAWYSTVGGGYSNIVDSSAEFAAIPGGRDNRAGGFYSFAAGRRAKAMHNGSFVWGDSTDADVNSTANNQFIIRASGGVGINTASPQTALDVNGTVRAQTVIITSDRGAKQDFAAVDAKEVLQRVASLPIQTWVFKEQPGTRHIGPMAQDFYAAFGVGADDKHIATVDADGAALAAIKGLYQMVKEKDAEIGELKRRLAAVESALAPGRNANAAHSPGHAPEGL
jgi:trimeric autotransporter adhesin